MNKTTEQLEQELTILNESINRLNTNKTTAEVWTNEDEFDYLNQLTLNTVLAATIEQELLKRKGMTLEDIKNFFRSKANKLVSRLTKK